MWLIAGIAAAAAGALAWWNSRSAGPQAAHTVATMRQSTGVLAAIVNMINAVLDALLLVRRVQAGAASTPDFGSPAARAA